MDTELKKILLAEDERPAAVLLRESLAGACPDEFALTWVDTLAKALGLLGAEAYDAVLLDLSLPDSYGLGTVERVCAAAPATPVVVLTSLDDEQVAVAALAQGAQDYLVKGETDSRSIARAIRYAIYRKRTEEELRRAKEGLELRVGERTEELRQTVEQLRAANAALAQRSGQLRALASELTLAEQRERRRLAQVLHDHLQQLLVAAQFRIGKLEDAHDPTVRRVGLEVSDLVSQAVEASRSLTGEISPPILREGGLVPALEWLARWMKKSHGLRVTLAAEAPVPPQAEDVTILLFQSVRELLLNVVKHARVSEAQVRVERLEGRVRITVSDEGAGFAPASLRTRGSPPGGGFGLFSVRERLDLMGGSLAVESAPGRGSRFTLVAPLGRAEQPAVPPEGETAGPEPSSGPQEGPAGVRPAPAARPAPGARREIRVLLADDHAITRQALADALAREPDIEVVGEAPDGEAAVALACLLRPDVILMDVGMPRVNGIDATRTIRRELPDVRIIGLSMYEETERGGAMREAGAVDYLTKSGSRAALLGAIRACARAR